MRQVKIEYENFEREENKALVAEIVLAYAWLFPVWLKTLTVSIYDKHENGKCFEAWSSGDPEYGTAMIGMLTVCLDKPEEWFREMIVHELLHIAHMRVYEIMHDRLMAGLEESNPDLYKFLKEDLRQRVEEFMENTAVGLVENMQGTSATVTIHPQKTWRPEELHRSDAQVVPEHKPLAMEGHRRCEGDSHD